MEAPVDFTTTLRRLMTRAKCTNRDLAQLTGISVNTIENWRGGEVRRPRFVSDVLKIAHALGLNTIDTTILLTAAGHPSLAQLQDQAEQINDLALAALLVSWEVPYAPTACVPTALPATPDHLSACHQLRAPVADFVGRAATITSLVTALQAAADTGTIAAISGVRGMGGIGKTELAYVVANRLRPTFPDGQ